MKSALGGLGWRPADFWDATLSEFFAAVSGHNESQGGEDEETAAPNQNEMADLLAKYG